MGCAVYNMPGIVEAQPLLYTALPQTFLHLGRDIDKRPPGGHLEPEFLVVAFHTSSLLYDFPFSEYGTKKSPAQPVYVRFQGLCIMLSSLTLGVNSIPCMPLKSYGCRTLVSETRAKRSRGAPERGVLE